MKTILKIVGGILLAIPAVWLLRNSRAVTGSARYQTVRTEGAVELRDYPALTLATAPMDDNRGNGSFGRLFGFISGKNTQAQKIPMTTPVLIDPAKGKQTMSFVLPEAIVNKGVPEPGDSQVRLSKTEPGRYAVLRFAGRANEKNEQIAVEKLQTWLRDHKIEADGEPLFAFYDPPWTPSFLRRNEVMIRVATGEEVLSAGGRRF